MYTLGNGFIPSANQLGVLDKKSPGKGGVPGQKKKEGGIGNSINYLLNLKQPIKEEVTIFLKYCEPVPKLIDRVQERRFWNCPLLLRGFPGLPLGNGMFIRRDGCCHGKVLHFAPAEPVGSVHYVQAPEYAFYILQGTAGVRFPAP
jgi:hypothetical protein